MPIAGPALAGLIQLQMTKGGFTGTKAMQLSQALGNGIINTILSSATYTGTSTGVGLGAGSSTGKLQGTITIGAAVGNLIFLQMGIFSILGTKAQTLSAAIGNAVATHMSTAIVQGSSTIVGIGTGVGTIVGVVGAAMGAAIQLQMTAMGLTGVDALKLANAVGNGVALAIQTSVAQTTIIGAAVGTVPPAFPPIPAVGIDSGKLI